MKNFLGFLIALMFAMPVASQAAEFQIVGEQVVAGVQTPAATKSAPPAKPKPAVIAPAPAKYAGPTLKQIGAEFSRQTTALENKSAREKVARETAVNSTLGTINGNIVTLNANLTDKKTGEFTKLGEKVEAIPSTFGGMLMKLFLALATVVVAVGVGIALYGKKNANRIEEKVDAVPGKTSEKVTEESVNANQPDCFIATINGRMFQYDYQSDGSVLFVQYDGSIAKFTDLNQAKRSLLRTIKNLQFNSKGELRYDSMSDAQANAIKTAIVKKHFRFQ